MHPSLFTREWPKLLRAQALETYGRRVEDKTDERRQRALLSDLVRAAAEAGGIGTHGIGAGWLVEFRASRDGILKQLLPACVRWIEAVLATNLRTFRDGRPRRELRG